MVHFPLRLRNEDEDEEEATSTTGDGDDRGDVNTEWGNDTYLELCLQSRHQVDLGRSSGF